MNEPIRFRGKAGQTHKRCPDCEQEKTLDQFFLCSHHWDGLATYCMTCEKTRKRLAVERKRQAREQIALAGIAAMEAAQQWDQGVKLLVQAWSRMIEVDTAVRLNKRDAGAQEVDGRLDARLVHPRAAFSLNISLMDAKFPMPFHVMRECGMGATLAEYIGQAPEDDYLGNDSTVQENEDGSTERDNAAERGQGQEEGRAEQGDSPSEGGHSPVRGRKRRAAAAVAG